MIALTHIPSPQMIAGERTFLPRLEIDLLRASAQHAAYCQALRECGCDVRTLEVNTSHPDGTFIEDTAVVLDEVAVLGSMGMAARRGEVAGIAAVLRKFRDLATIDLPATLEGGDVLRVGRKLLVGLSPRTNAAGIEALVRIADRYGDEVLAVPVRGCLHLKTACTALPDGRLLVNPAWLDTSILRGFETWNVPTEEPWGANLLLVGDCVLLDAANVRTAALVRAAGFTVREMEISEFAKAEGGVSCLSLLINDN